MQLERIVSTGKIVRLMQGDITKVPADAIANAANSALAGGGGVDGAIHRAGGPSIMAELDQIRASQGGCPTGGAVVTTAGKLPAEYVFHAVGPVYRGGKQGEPQALASCYRECMKLAAERGVKSITFPSISTGVYGYPVEEAARIALQAVAEALSHPNTSVDTTTFVLFDARTLQAYSSALAETAEKPV